MTFGNDVEFFHRIALFDYKIVDAIFFDFQNISDGDEREGLEILEKGDTI